MLDKMSALYRIKLDEEGLIVEGFADALKLYSTSQISQAFERIVKRDEWFPTIAHTLGELRSLFPGDEYIALPSPPQTVEDVAEGIVVTGFIKTVPALQRKLGKGIDYEVEYKKFRKANWTDALKRAAKEMVNARKA